MTKPRDAGIPMLTMGAGMVAFPAPAGLEDLFSPGLLIAMLTLLGIVPLSRFLDGPDDRLAILKMVAKIFPGLRVFPMKVTAPWYRASAKNWKAKLHWLEATEGTLLHRSEPSRLQIEFRFGKKVPTFGVRPKGRASMYLRIWAGKSCRTGDEDFDRRFVFKAFANTFVDRFRQSGLPKVVRKLALFRRGTIFGISMGGGLGANYADRTDRQSQAHGEIPVAFLSFGGACSRIVFAGRAGAGRRFRGSNLSHLREGDGG